MKILLLPLLLAFGSSLAFAQTAPPQAPTGQGGQQEQTTRDGLWEGRLEGGNYIVRCNSIIALSKHEYIVDGSARVAEVNITLNSAQIVRFYFLEPVKVEGTGMIGAGQQAIDRARQLVQDAASRVSPTITEPKVVKTYPGSTHAHTVEFVLKEEARLDDLYASLNRSLRTGVGRVWQE